MKRRQSAGVIVASLLLISSSCVKVCAQNDSQMLREFKNPPNSAKPLVWWHWMNGNISKEGIDLDLHWMKRVGIGGFQNFDADLNTPQVVQKRIAYMTPEWKDAFLYATKMADALGLEEAIASSPGWSETGGPWVQASQAMKKYVWSETIVEGGKPFKGTLVKPPSNTGPFQSLPYIPQRVQPKGVPGPPEFYADSAVIAYQLPVAEQEAESMRPKVTASGGSLDASILCGGDLSRYTELSIPATGEQSWIQYDFGRPQTIRAVTFVQIVNDQFNERVGGLGIKVLEASDDGETFRAVVQLPNGGAIEHTVSFPAVTARFFRLTFKRMQQATPVETGVAANKARLPGNYKISEFVLHPDARVNRFEEKVAFTAAFAFPPDFYSLATPPVAGSNAIVKNDVVDLTARLHADGTLDWTPPPGKWMVLRFGYSLIGTPNHPASKEAFGLEVDKLNRGHVKTYMDRYLGKFEDVVGPGLMGAHGIRYMVSDSWEAGGQNWTDDMIAQFIQLRGYDPRSWMPVLTGRIVESSEASDRFLWDFRKTIADLTINGHYGQIDQSLKERGLAHYGEAHEVNRAFLGDGMEVKKYDDIPMGAMWARSPDANQPMFGAVADLRESASAAHVYGQNLAAAESLTSVVSPWMWSPATLKPTVDREMAEGINRFVIHCSVHQPIIDQKPGMTLAINGQFFSRNETWAEEAGPWMTYLARSSYLLQQGRFSADIAYFYGEDTNLTALFAARAPNIPAGYDFDYINADVLLHRLSVMQGQLVTSSGIRYRVLALDENSRHMSLPVLKALMKLVEEGAVVVGPKPMDDPSLADDETEFATLSEWLFGDGKNVHRVGKGAIYPSSSLADVLTTMKVMPDFAYTKPRPDTTLLFVHRRLTDGDIYYVAHRNPRVESVEATFRVAGKSPELWHPDTGKIEPVSYNVVDGRTVVPLQLDSFETVFVVFQKPAKAPSLSLPTPVEKDLLTVSGSWNVSFEAGRGAPDHAQFETLSSWSDYPDLGVKYFSGTAIYTKTIDAPATWFSPESQLWLKLGNVRNLAEVTVNGKPLGIAWKEPYRLEMTNALHPGVNSLKIAVTNSWVNRLIGDQQPDARQYTFTTYRPYTAESPLLPSGLLGPVQIYSVRTRR